MSTGFERWRAATLGPFEVRIFAAIWIATLVSTFGSLIQGVGASWLMISIAPSADMVALVQTSITLPIMLLSLVVLSLRGGVSQRDAMNVEIIGLYWHFVDIVWVVIFTVVYLIPYKNVPTEGAEHSLRFLQSLSIF